MAPGAPINVRHPDGATGVRVERPDGSVDERGCSRRAATVTFARTDQLGLHGDLDPRPGGEPVAHVGRGVLVARRVTRGLGRHPARRRRSGRPIRPHGARFTVGCSTSTSPGSPRRRRPGFSRRSEGRGVPGRRHRRGRPPRSGRNARDELWIPVVLSPCSCSRSSGWCTSATRWPDSAGHRGTAPRGPPGRQGRVMGISFDAPLALLLLGSLVAVVVALHLVSRRRPATGGGGWRSWSGRCCSRRSLRAGGLPAGAAGDRLAVVYVVDMSDSVGTAGREEALAYLRESLAAARTRTWRGSWRSAATRSWSGSRPSWPRSTGSRRRPCARPPTSGPRYGWPAPCSPTMPRSGSCCCRTATTPPGRGRRRLRSPPPAGSRSRRT